MYLLRAPHSPGHCPGVPWTGVCSVPLGQPVGSCSAPTPKRSLRSTLCLPVRTESLSPSQTPGRPWSTPGHACTQRSRPLPLAQREDPWPWSSTPMSTHRCVLCSCADAARPRWGRSASSSTAGGARCYASPARRPSLLWERETWWHCAVICQRRNSEAFRCFSRWIHMHHPC